MKKTVEHPQTYPLNTHILYIFQYIATYILHSFASQEYFHKIASYDANTQKCIQYRTANLEKLKW